MQRCRANIDWHEITVISILINVTAPHLAVRLKNITLLRHTFAGISIRQESIQIHQFLIIILLVAEVSAKDTERWLRRLMKPVGS